MIKTCFNKGIIVPRHCIRPRVHSARTTTNFSNKHQIMHPNPTANNIFLKRAPNGNLASLPLSAKSINLLPVLVRARRCLLPSSKDNLSRYFQMTSIARKCLEEISPASYNWKRLRNLATGALMVTKRSIYSEKAVLPSFGLLRIL